MRRRVGKGGRGAERACIVPRRGSEGVQGPECAGEGRRGSSECVREGGMGTPSLPLPHTLGPSRVQGSDTVRRRGSRGGQSVWEREGGGPSRV
jgi:hypothetical protein